MARARKSAVALLATVPISPGTASAMPADSSTLAAATHQKPSRNPTISAMAESTRPARAVRTGPIRLTSRAATRQISNGGKPARRRVCSWLSENPVIWAPACKLTKANNTVQAASHAPISCVCRHIGTGFAAIAPSFPRAMQVGNKRYKPMASRAYPAANASMMTCRPRPANCAASNCAAGAAAAVADPDRQRLHHLQPKLTL